MEIRTAAIYGLFVMMCINAGGMMLTHIGIVGMPVSAWNETKIDESLNTTEIVETWSWQDTSFYDIATGMLSFWYRAIPVIESFLGMLQSFGCPSFIYNPLHNIWRFMWMSFVTLVIFAGRNV